MAFLVGGANSTTDFNIENSCRFDEASSAEMTFTPSSDGTKTKWTISCWFKRGVIDGTRRVLFGSVDDYLRITDDETIQFLITDNGGTARSWYSPAKIRDPSAWYHVVATWDSTQGTAANRQRVWLNGEALSPNSFTEASQNATSASINNGSAVHNIGGELNPANDDHWDGYISELYFIDGTGYTASTFGETDDNGVWVPIKASPTFGSNGFFMEFKQTGTSANASGIGADTSGNDNHFAVSNLAATDITTDTPTNNFATLNPLDAGSEGTLSEGNTKYTGGTTSGSGELQMAGGTFGVSNGKWYFEVKRGANDSAIGIYAAEHPGVNIGHQNPFVSGWNGYSHFVYTSDGNARSGNANTSYGGAVHDGDIIGVALDLDNGAIYYSDNGTFMNSGDPTSGASKTGAASNFTTTVETWILGFIGDGASASASVAEFNFGNPAFSISSGNADANGYGNFEYAVPSGYYAPCTKNLAKYG